jgi:hypothetical protein
MLENILDSTKRGCEVLDFKISYILEETFHFRFGHKNLFLSDKSIEPPVVLLVNSKEQQR